MANPYHEDQDLARPKESSIYVLKLFKKHRKDMNGNNLPPTCPNSKEIKFKTFSSLFTPFFVILGSTSPEHAMRDTERRKKLVCWGE